ncbi:S41 family peptidase [Chitinophagaceae bacterium MMS25-I14]
MNLPTCLKGALCLLLLPFAACAQHSYNLDMEQLNASGMPDKWEVHFAGSTSNAGYEISLDSITKQHGRYALGIEKKVDGGQFGVCYTTIPAQFSGHRIKLSGYLKTKDVADGFAGIWLRVDGEGSVLAFDNMQSRGLKGTNDWKQFEIELDYDEEQAKMIYAGALLAGKGKVWVDNLELTIDGKDAASAIGKKTETIKAKLDTALNKTSGISSVSYNGSKLQQLVNLGQVWGFLKYYHPAIADGTYNWDAELFRFLPDYNAAATDKEAYLLLEKWVDKLGKVPVCIDCKSDSPDIKLKPDYGQIFAENNLPASLVAKLEFIRDNHSGSGRQYYIDKAEGVGNPVFRNELGYIYSVYPDAGIRLLALYRYWNMVQYFCPNRHLAGDWNKVLPELIPVFADARDDKEYAFACLQMVGLLHDGHGQLMDKQGTLELLKGRYALPVMAAWIEEKMVVTDYYTTDSTIREKVKKGDVITAIDGVPVNTLIDKYRRYTPASNDVAQIHYMMGYYGFLNRGDNSRLQLDIVRKGEKMSVVSERIPFNKVELPEAASHKAYEMIPGNIGYIYPALLKDGDLDSIMAIMQSAKGIVIDMRCYPHVFMPFSFGNWLKPRASDFVRFSTLSFKKPGQFSYSEPQANGEHNAACYKGKLVIIVNEQTQSQAEYTTMALRTAPGAVVIGSTTAGADGNVSSVVLPGGFMSLISGIGIYYPDKTETQRTGVKIDEKIKPTIKGIAEGRDELLDRAVQIIRKG